jgi:hypothetical protein
MMIVAEQINMVSNSLTQEDVCVEIVCIHIKLKRHQHQKLYLVLHEMVSQTKKIPFVEGFESLLC